MGSEVKHTPGPLTTRRAMHPDNTGGYDHAVLDDGGAIIAECFENVGNGLGRPAKANASLFAAAPDLLAACEAALLYLDECQPPRVHDGPCGPEAGCDAGCMDLARWADDFLRVRKAIAKAKGGLSC